MKINIFFYFFYLETQKFFEKKLDIFDWIFENGRLAVRSAGEHSVSLELSLSRFPSSNASTNDSFKFTFSGTICDDSEFLKDWTSIALSSHSSSSPY